MYKGHKDLETTPTMSDVYWTDTINPSFSGWRNVQTGITILHTDCGGTVDPIPGKQVGSVVYHEGCENGYNAQCSICGKIWCMEF